MNSTLHFQLVTPKRIVLNEELLSISCPTTLGQITILPNHTPLVATLAPGELLAKTASGEQFLHVSGGFIEVRANNAIIVLADEAEHATEISEAETTAAIARAKERMAEISTTDEEYAHVAASLERSLSRLRVVRRHSHRRNTPITSEGVFNE